MRVTGVLSGLVVALGVALAGAESVAPHAGHVMPAATPTATEQVPPVAADPHAGHDMAAMDHGEEGEATSPMAQRMDKMEGKMMRKQAKLERQMGKLNKIDALLAEMGRRVDAMAAAATPEERAKLAAQHREGLLRAVALLKDVGDAGMGGGMMGGMMGDKGGGGHEQHGATAGTPEPQAAPAGGHDQHADGDKGGMMGGDKGDMMGGDKGGMMGEEKIHMHQVMERRLAALLEIMGQMLKQMEAGR